MSRRVELDVGEGGVGLEVSGLDVEFKVRRSVTLGENVARFRIYNAQSQTRKDILKVGNTLVFKAGYEDEGIGTIFVGQITQATSAKRSGDWMTDVQATSLRGQDKSLEYVTLSLSYGAGTKVVSPLRDVAAALGLTVFGSDQAQVSMANGFVYAGSARGALTQIEKVLRPLGRGLYVDNASVVVYDLGQQASGVFGSSLLGYDTGLLEAEDVTDAQDREGGRRRVRWRSILVPKIAPSGLITIDTLGLSGTFIVQQVEHLGDNFGGDFNSEGEALE